MQATDLGRGSDLEDNEVNPIFQSVHAYGAKNRKSKPKTRAELSERYVSDHICTDFQVLSAELSL